jgi:S-(hydroxymethyl)glutathione dehydrogenase/alcohol dehydrogenase
VRAAVTWEAGGPFDVRQVEIRQPGPGEVAVDIHACGVCASDLALTTVFGAPTPTVLGHEGSGVIAAVGEGVDPSRVGQHVVVAWITPCLLCEQCLRGALHLCARRKATSDGGPAQVSPLSADGREIHQGMATSTFAERTIVRSGSAITIDPSVPHEVAAMLGCAVPTGVGAALRNAEVSPGDHVAVIGAGAVGMSAVLGALVGGASRVVSVDPSPVRRERSLAVGSHEAVEPDGLADLGPFDVVIDAVGRPETVSSAWAATRRGGHITVVGAGRPGMKVELDAFHLFHDAKTIRGCFAGDLVPVRDLSWMVDLWKAGLLPVEKLIDGTADLAHINEVTAAQVSGQVLRTIVTTGR